MILVHVHFLHQQVVSKSESVMPYERFESMPRQRIHHYRDTNEFPDDFPQRLNRFKEQSGLSWAELNRRIGTDPETVRRWRKGTTLPNAIHMMALCKLADEFNLGSLLTA